MWPIATPQHALSIIPRRTTLIMFMGPLIPININTRIHKPTHRLNPTGRNNIQAILHLQRPNSPTQIPWHLR